MARQPSYRPLQPSEFFADGRSARPPVPGAVARGYLRDDPHLYDGGGGPAAEVSRAVALVGAGSRPLLALAAGASLGDAPVDSFPFAVTEVVLQRGRERFNIYCAVCHDRVGTGNGRIVQRGYVRPPSFHTDRLREAPVGHYFRVITRGHGAMPDYAAQIAPADRWAIVAYVRALQLSQNARLDDVPEDIRRRLTQERVPR
jgi:mono/diheme cytochrome c family protein